MDSNTATLLGLVVTSLAGIVTTWLKEKYRDKEEDKKRGDASGKDKVSDSDDDR